MPDPERPIEAMIAAVRQEIEDWDKAEKAASWGALRGENYAQRASLRGALRVLEAAKAWGADVEAHGLRQALRQGAASSAINLLHAIRGEPE